MKVAAVVSDLMLFSRIDAAARVSGVTLQRADAPADVPAVGADRPELVLVDWMSRDPSWTEPLHMLRAAGSRVILFGPHTDLEAHAAAREAGLSPMWARSKLVGSLVKILAANGAGHLPVHDEP